MRGHYFADAVPQRDWSVVVGFSHISCFQQRDNVAPKPCMLGGMFEVAVADLRWQFLDGAHRPLPTCACVRARVYAYRGRDNREVHQHGDRIAGHKGSGSWALKW